MPEPGNDVDLGPFEARLRDPYGVMDPIKEKQLKPLDPIPTPDSEIERATKKLPWTELLPPKLDWWYREVIIRGSTIDATATEIQVFRETVPKAQTLVIEEFTPILLQADPSTPNLFMEMDRFQHLGRIYAELRASSRAPLNADTRVTTLGGAFSGGTTQANARGTGIMNQRAFTSDPTFPMGLYIPSESIVTVVFRLFDSTGGVQQLQNMDGGGTSLAFGCKFLGFYMSNKEADYITGSRS